MRWLGALLLIGLCSSCTYVSMNYTKPDGTVLNGSYISTKTQENPQFTLNRDADNTVSVAAGATRTDGVDKEKVAELLKGLMEALAVTPVP